MENSNKKYLPLIFILILLVIGGTIYFTKPVLLTGAVKKLKVQKTAKVDKKKSSVKKPAAVPLPPPQNVLTQLPPPAAPPLVSETVVTSAPTFPQELIFKVGQYLDESLAEQKRANSLLEQILAYVSRPIPTMITPQEPSPLPATPPAPPPPPPPPPEPITYYSFDEGIGSTAKDAGSYGHNGNIVPGTAWIVGKIGNALNFSGDAEQQFVNLGASLGLNLTEQITIEAWFQTTAVANPGDQRFLYRRSGNYGVALYEDNEGRIGFSFVAKTDAGPKFTIVLSPESYNDGAWHHVVGTYDHQSAKLYLDGEAVGSRSSSDTIYYETQHSAIGRNANEGGRYWQGAIDEVKIYDVGLTYEQVKKAYEGH